MVKEKIKYEADNSDRRIIEGINEVEKQQYIHKLEQTQAELKTKVYACQYCKKQMKGDDDGIEIQLPCFGNLSDFEGLFVHIKIAQTDIYGGVKPGNNVSVVVCSKDCESKLKKPILTLSNIVF